jgi:alpha-beta hydrolase superfamily lysophospholipase
MKHEEGHRKSFDGLDLFFQSWAPEERPRGAVALVHGIGEHSGRYAHVAEAYVGAGYAFAAIDLRGHGKSSGPRLYAPSYEQIMKDIDGHLAGTRARFPDAPLFLYGHSMGGSLVLRYGLTRGNAGLTGVIASSPGLGSGTPQPLLKVLFGRIMNKLIPTLVISLGFPFEGLSHDPALLERTRADPLFQEGISVRLGFEILRAGEWIKGKTSFPFPLLIMQGTGDRHVDPGMTTDFARNLQSGVTLRIWDGLYHELHNEKEKDRVISFMIDWVKTHS